MKFENREQQLLEMLNSAWKCLPPVEYNDFNIRLDSNNIEELYAIEYKYPELGIYSSSSPICKSVGISTLSILATITDVFCNKRLAAIINDGIITGWTWYNVSC